MGKPSNGVKLKPPTNVNGNQAKKNSSNSSAKMNGHFNTNGNGTGGTRSRPSAGRKPQQPPQKAKSGGGGVKVVNNKVVNNKVDSGKVPTESITNNNGPTMAPTTTISGRFTSSSSTATSTSSLTSSTTTTSPEVTTTTSPPQDLSQINFPYDIRLNGFSSLVNTVKKSTEKVRKILMDECDVILECRTCRNLFRSIPNYISHKETFCTAEFHPTTTEGFSRLIQTNPESSKSIPMSSSFQIEHHVHSTLTKEIEQVQKAKTKIQKSARLAQLLAKILPTIQELGAKPPSELYTQIVRAQAQKDSSTPAQTVQLSLEPLGGTNTQTQPSRTLEDGIVFQKRIQSDPSICDTMTNKPLNGVIQPNDTAVLDGEGKVLVLGSAGVVQDIVSKVIAQIEEGEKAAQKKMKSLNCHICQTVFDTEKSLRIHKRTHYRKKKALAATAAATAIEETIEVPSIPMPIPNPTSSSAGAEVSKLPNSPQGKSLPPQSPSNLNLSLKTLSCPPPQGKLNEIVKKLRMEKNPSSAQVLEGAPGEKSPVIPFIPTSPIFSFKSGRATNNSCSAGLSAMSPVKTQFPELDPDLDLPTTPPKVQPAAAAPLRKRGRPRRSITAADTVCKNCQENFSAMNKSDISIHLAECTGSINLSLVRTPQSPDITEERNRSSIQIRRDYSKPSTSPSPSPSGKSKRPPGERIPSTTPSPPKRQRPAHLRQRLSLPRAHAQGRRRLSSSAQLAKSKAKAKTTAGTPTDGNTTKVKAMTPDENIPGSDAENQNAHVQVLEENSSPDGETEAIPKPIPVPDVNNIVAVSEKSTISERSTNSASAPIGTEKFKRALF